MNCRRLQDVVFEYLEGSLSPATRAAAEMHLASCDACREIVRRNQRLAQTLSERFHRDTELLAFGPEEHRRLMAALEDRAAASAEEQPIRAWWRRLAWAAATASAILVVASLMTGFPFRSRVGTVSPPSGGSDARVWIRASYCAPTYTFRREGNLVVDSLTCDPRVVEQTLWLSRNQPGLTKQETKSRL